VGLLQFADAEALHTHTPCQLAEQSLAVRNISLVCLAAILAIMQWDACLASAPSSDSSLSLRAIRQIIIYPKRKAPAYLSKQLEDRPQCLLSTSASIHGLNHHDLHIPESLRSSPR